MNEMMLIVDDQRINREVLKAIFNNKYEILEAENGEEALAMIKVCQGSIDIVLLDLMLGELSGFDVLEIRKDMDAFKEVPVVVITSSEHMDDQIKAFELGANEYILKPFVPEIVLSRVNNVMASNRRIAAIQLEAQKMRMKSEMDEMTGLCNKTTSEFHMDKILQLSEDCMEVMLVIDIDNFKTVNDTCGHQEGDRVIKTIANLISSSFRKSDIVGRIGGDEFCVLMVDVGDIEIARSKANELIQTMKYKPNFHVPEYVTLSIGMASNDKKDCSYKKLFEKADEALYEAKQSGKARYREYHVEPVDVEKDLRPLAILLSESRNVRSTIQALIPTHMKLGEIARMEELGALSKKDRENTWLVYIDISQDDDEKIDIMWKQLKTYDWIDPKKVIVICEEGNIPQYTKALQAGMADMFTTPIDHEAFKRRTTRLLEKLGISEIKPSEETVPNGNTEK